MSSIELNELKCNTAKKKSSNDLKPLLQQQNTKANNLLVNSNSNLLINSNSNQNIVDSNDFDNLSATNINLSSSNKKKSRHFSIAYSNRINFNYSPDLKKKDSQVKLKDPTLLNLNNQQQQPNNKIGVWNKLNKKKIDTSLTNLQSNNNAITKLGSFSNANHSSNLNLADVNQTYTNNKTGSFTNLNDRNSYLSFDDSNLIRNDLNANYDANLAAKPSICFYLCCCLYTSPSPSTANISSNNQTQRLKLFKFYLIMFLSKLRHYIAGLIISVILCVSFVLMTYLLRSTLNTIEFNDAHYFNNTGLNNHSMYNLNIELNVKKITISCDYCYLIVWSATSCLIFVYPVFFICYYVILSKHKKLGKSASSTAQANGNNVNKASSPSLNTNSNANETSTASNLNKMSTPKQNSESSTNNTSLTAPNARAGYCGIIRGSFDIFNVKKKHDINLTMNSSSKMARFKAKRDYLCKLLLITLVWVLTGFTYIRAIDILYSSDVVILFSVNFSFVFMATWVVLHYKFVPLRLLGFILSIAAIIFTYYSEGFLFNSKFLGNCCATAAAAGSAVLQIIWKINTKNKDNGQKTMFLSLMGLCNLLVGWPIIFLFYFSGIETLNYSNTQLLNDEQKNQIFSNLAGATLLGFVYIFLLQFGSLFVNELFLQIGCILAIPLSLFIDLKLNELEVNDLKIGAFMCVLIGYIFLAIPEDLYSQCKGKFFPDPQEHIETSLTRRYKYTSPPAPSPVLNNGSKTNSNQLIKSSLTINSKQNVV